MVRTLQYFLRKLKMFFDHENIIKWPQKLHTHGSLNYIQQNSVKTEKMSMERLRYFDLLIALYGHFYNNSFSCTMSV